MSIPSSPEQTAATLDAIDSAMDDCKTVYVHCWGGVGRTGLSSVAGSSGMVAPATRRLAELRRCSMGWRSLIALMNRRKQPGRKTMPATGSSRHGGVTP